VSDHAKLITTYKPTPMSASADMLIIDDEPVNQPEYRSIVGTLLYSVVCSRPDLAFVASIFSWHLEFPCNCHWRIISCMIFYILFHSNMVLTYKSQTTNMSDFMGAAYCDADWAGEQLSSKSTSGYAIYVNSSLFALKSAQQKTISLSTVESELIAAPSCTTDCIFVKNITKFITKSKVSITLFMDNAGAISLAHNGFPTARTCHIHIRFDIIKNLIDKDILDVKHVSGVDNIADIFTKPLDKFKFTFFVPQFNLTPQ
jgi:hypothetical protein